VQEWLGICNDLHETCLPPNTEPTILPKRVLDVNRSHVKLRETSNEPGQYVCLSHYWGATRPECRTTSATLEGNVSGISWDALPATFQEAIDFTRRLGLRYIWIDSICIIQNDDKDWTEQSSLIADIYENAYVTLCATASSSDDGGCYSSIPPHWMPQKILARKRDGTEYEVYIRQELDKRHIPPWCMATGGIYRSNFPLMTRAWAYQERLLSPRLVHFAMGEVMWECSELSLCECFQRETDRPSPFLEMNTEKQLHRNVLLAPIPGAAEKHWRQIVFAYSGLDLSLEKDKLPALSGVAKQMSKRRPGDEYLAGL
jgi:hypothetical protein